VRVLPSLALLLPALLVACTDGDLVTPTSTATEPTADFGIITPPVDTDWPDTDVDADTDADADSDTDADTDADTDTDVGDTDTDVQDTDVVDTDVPTDTDVTDTDVTDTDITDTDDTNPPCELTYEVLVRDASSETCLLTACTAAEEISVVAIAKNDCSVAIASPGTTDCIASSYVVEEILLPTADTRSRATCTGTPQMIAAGTQLEQPVSFGTMTANDYVARVTFADTAVTVVSTNFIVAP
jgi:hypothetical protein